MKILHMWNAFLYLLNAILWASIAHMPWFALVWGAVAVGELWVVKKILEDE